MGTRRSVQEISTLKDSFVLWEKTVGAYRANADFEQALQAFLANKDRDFIGKGRRHACFELE